MLVQLAKRHPVESSKILHFFAEVFQNGFPRRNNAWMREFSFCDNPDIQSGVLREANHYEYESRDGRVVACVERRKVQWYQWEVLHLSVDETVEKKGLAFLVYERVESAARRAGVRVLQCTIREGNKESAGFFDRQGFSKVSRFVNRETGNTVGVWQKVLSEPRREEGAEEKVE
jgi:ribosomal protein S18 acetylase RimI-like enzyme